MNFINHSYRCVTIDITKLQKIKSMNYKEKNMIDIDITKFKQLPLEFQKIILVIPWFPLGNEGGMYELISNYQFDIIDVKREKEKLSAKCIGYDRMPFYFETEITKISEIDVYKFFDKMKEIDIDLLNKYFDAINSIFFNSERNIEDLKNNKHLTKIRRKYE